MCRYDPSQEQMYQDNDKHMEYIMFRGGVYCKQIFLNNLLVKEMWYANGKIHRDRLSAVIEYNSNGMTAE